MKNIQFAMRKTAFCIISLFLLSAVIPAYGSTADEQNYAGKEELVQMLAPIALYPDSLLAQVLMASTYPLEIIEAERWLRKNKNLKGETLHNALRDKDWDTSIKSLCHFPDVIFALSDKLDQTRRLGDAFLSQEEEVMDTVQELRSMAYKQGNLKTTGEQKIIVEREVIKIEPAVSRTVYVPVYDPLYVYGPWRYPAYPPYYWHYPSGYPAGVRYVRFGHPVYISAGWFSWAWFDWPAFRICIVVHNASRYHKPSVRHVYANPYWRHIPHHRRRVDYRDRRTSDRYTQRPPSAPESKPKKHIYPRVEQAKQRTAPDREKSNISRQKATTEQARPNTYERLTDRRTDADITDGGLRLSRSEPKQPVTDARQERPAPERTRGKRISVRDRVTSKRK